MRISDWSSDVCSSDLLGAEVELAKDLAQREAANLTVVGGEAAVLEHGRTEEVGGHHRHDDTGVGERALETVDLRLTLGVGGAEGEQVVVVERQAVRAELRELLDDVDDVQRRSGGTPEGVGAVVADGPETERELVLGSGGGHGSALSSSKIVAEHNL